MSDKLAKKCAKVSGVINIPTGQNLTSREVENALKSIFDKYALILHEDEVNEETGEVKTPHYHFVGVSTGNRRLRTWLDDLAQSLSVPENCVSVSACVSESGSLMYLTHENRPDKKQYSPDEVITNNLEWYNSKKLCQKIDVGQLIEIIRECHYSYVQIAQVLGLELFQKYNYSLRLLVPDLQREDYTQGLTDELNDY